MSASQRQIATLPIWVIAFIPIAILMQIGWHQLTSNSTATIKALPAPPASERLKVLSLGEPQLLSRLSQLWLQAYDNQPGISLSFNDLDYKLVNAWLDTALKLDTSTQYPLFAASHIYAQVKDPIKKRQITDFIRDKFVESPNTRWRWMANAVIVAKHELKDLTLAADYANELRRLATGSNVPHWAQQMEIFLLEDMGEYERAQLMLGALLSSGEITDKHESYFLTQRLNQLRAASSGKK